jgi:ribosomal protein S27AE/IS1 family transposase
MTHGENQSKMLRAIQAFSRLKKTNRSLTSRQYQLARNLTAGLPSWNKGKTITDYTTEQKEALRKSGITKRGRTQTAEANAKRSATQSGRPAHNKGKPMPFKGRVSPTKGMTHPKKPCPHCGKEVAANTMAKWHGDRCHFSFQRAYM